MEENTQPKVELAENGMSASLILPGDFDRGSLTTESCESMLTRAGVDGGVIDHDLIAQVVAQAQAADAGPFGAVIAKATPAVHGIDARIEWVHEDEQTDAPSSDPSDDGSEDDPVSFYSYSGFTVVKEGEVLGKIHPEVPGTEGRDVKGKVLAARTAKPLELKYDESIAVDEQHHLVAQNDGVLIRDRLTAKVSDTLEVDRNVDFSTGNIDFPGSVIVQHGVKDCFTVETRDDVEVRGLIEAASIIAGRDFHAKGGFAGREQGTAEVAGTFYAKYLDAVESHICGDLCVEREVINCKTTVLGNINCPRGAIIGGSTRVSGTVELMDLGASAQPITEFHVGALPHLDPLIDRLQNLVDQLIEDRDKLLSEQETITANSGARLAPSHQAKLAQINREMALIQLQLDRAEPSLEQVIERAESIRKIDVTIHRKLHPNALLVFKGYRYRVTEEIKGPIRIASNKRDQLEFQFAEDKPQLLSKFCDLRTAA